MNFVSTSPLRYFQRKGNGRYGAREYKIIGRKDPFRYGQVALYPRFGSHLTNVERRISNPGITGEDMRNFY
jgi:hypothetical protein